jgi:hypothetical protein
MTELSDVRSYRLTRSDGLGFVRHRSAAQFAIACGGIGLGLLAVVIRAAGAGGRVGLALGGVLVVAFGAGRTPGGENFVDLVAPIGLYAKARLFGRHRWAAALVAWDGPELPPAFAGITLLERPAADNGGGRVGVITDRADGSVSIVLRVHGEGFLLADGSEKDDRLSAFGNALASIAREDGAVTRVSWSQHVAPASFAAHRAYLAQTARADPDEAMAAAYATLLTDAARIATSAEVLVTLTVSLARVRTSAPGKSERLHAGIEQLLDEAKLFAGQLARAGLVVVGPLPAGVIARALRERLDPDAASHLERRTHHLSGVVSIENGFPLAIEERASSIAVDESVHRLFRIAEWPRSAVSADWLASFLCAGEVTRSVTVIFTPLSRRIARRQALAVATRVGANLDERARKGRRVGAEERRAHQAAEALDEELEGGAAMELVCGLVDVAAPNIDVLDSACERVRQAAATVGLELRTVTFRQGASLLASLPLGRAVLGRAR